jgi:hypothetical protein
MSISACGQLRDHGFPGHQAQNRLVLARGLPSRGQGANEPITQSQSALSDPEASTPRGRLAKQSRRNLRLLPDAIGCLIL